MKFKSVVGLFILASSTFIAHAKVELFFINKYKKPIYIKINATKVQDPIEDGKTVKIADDINNLLSFGIRTKAMLHYSDFTDKIKTVCRQPENSVVNFILHPSTNMIEWRPEIICKNQPTRTAPQISSELALCKTKNAEYFISNQIIKNKIYGEALAKRAYYLKVAQPTKNGRNRFEHLKTALIKCCDEKLTSTAELEQSLKQTLNQHYRNMLQNPSQPPTFNPSLNITYEQLEKARPNTNE